jgi:hypothetical protein
MGPQSAARVGDWKLVRRETEQLFNLAEDMGEKNDLAAAQPEKLKEVKAAYDEWNAKNIPAKWVRQDARTAGRTGVGGEQRANALERFKQLDRNGDGKVTKDEFDKPKLFQRLDRNGDGAISREEVEAVAGTGGGREEQKAPDPKAEMEENNE